MSGAVPLQFVARDDDSDGSDDGAVIGATSCDTLVITADRRGAGADAAGDGACGDNTRLTVRAEQRGGSDAGDCAQPEHVVFFANPRGGGGDDACAGREPPAPARAAATVAATQRHGVVAANRRPVCTAGQRKKAATAKKRFLERRRRDFCILVAFTFGVATVVALLVRTVPFRGPAGDTGACCLFQVVQHVGDDDPAPSYEERVACVDGGTRAACRERGVFLGAHTACPAPGDAAQCPLVRDCEGTAFGTAVYDACDGCNGDGTACTDCAGAANGAAAYDACDVCGGDGTVCIDCRGIANGAAVYDVCDVCGGDGSTCIDCRGVANGGAAYGACDVCGGSGSTCADCAGVPNGAAVYDACDVCGGDTSSCIDCRGVPNGAAVYDACGVCDGVNLCLMMPRPPP